MRVIISGGGTGGHIYPAIAIAEALKAAIQDVDILFVGALGRMEMEKVPEAGYRIEGLPIAGLQRKFTLKNLSLPFKLFSSIRKSVKIIRDFKPDVCVGVGGYASGPLLRAAQKKGIPTVIQEQNSYAGVTNKLLAKQAKAICVAYDRMERFFPKAKLMLTGNPVRKDILDLDISNEKARSSLGLEAQKLTVVVMGGSLGARSLNEAMINASEAISKRQEIQWLWQVGKTHYEACSKSATAGLKNVQCQAFIKDMAAAYRASDVVVCRAGALTISELCIVGKPAILVPSPYVAEDHQSQNAMALVRQHAAIMVKDANANAKLVDEVFYLVDHEKQRDLLKREIIKLGRPNAVERIVKIITTVSDVN